MVIPASHTANCTKRQMSMDWKDNSLPDLKSKPLFAIVETGTTLFGFAGRKLKFPFNLKYDFNHILFLVGEKRV